MMRIDRGLIIKLAILLVIPFTLTCCHFICVSVYIYNFTNMNFHVKLSGTAGEGVRVKPGAGVLVGFFCKDYEDRSYELCREYGCLARLDITVEEGRRNEAERVYIYEHSTDVFSFQEDSSNLIVEISQISENP